MPKDQVMMTSEQLELWGMVNSQDGIKQVLDRSKYFKKGGRDGKAPTKVKPEWQVILSA